MGESLDGERGRCAAEVHPRRGDVRQRKRKRPGRSPTDDVQTSRRENTKDPEDPIGNGEGQEGSREATERLRVLLGAGPTACGRGRTPRPWRFPTPRPKWPVFGPTSSLMASVSRTTVHRESEGL